MDSERFWYQLDQAQLLVGIYLLGFGPSQFIYGPISDAIGRKRFCSPGWLSHCLALC
ncbi:multidrug resistance protein D [Vibrio maritimus]|uniref:Multidrug resistance protein D n=1 Tax=Vibrio maritimus TaxID=990268 RepID=A0A090T487_9VIBR|nr:multidrug resistance protein D [Vibrio maritimus]